MTSSRSARSLASPRPTPGNPSPRAALVSALLVSLTARPRGAGPSSHIAHCSSCANRSARISSTPSSASATIYRCRATSVTRRSAPKWPRSRRSPTTRQECTTRARARRCDDAGKPCILYRNSNFGSAPVRTASTAEHAPTLLYGDSRLFKACLSKGPPAVPLSHD